MSKGEKKYSELPGMKIARKAGEGLQRALDGTAAEKEVVITDTNLRDVEVEIQGETEALRAEAVTVAPEIEARDALREAPVLLHQSNREKVRLLILTRDVSITNAGGLSQKRILELSEMFSEIHIIALTMWEDGAEKTARITNNVWIYATNSKFWWKMGFDGFKIANEQLTFTQGFRADIILAEDPFESGIVGHYLAEKYDRPLQIHIFEDFFNPGFKGSEAHNDVRVFMPRFAFKNASCVRVKSEYLKDRLLEKFPSLGEFTEVLPMYYNLSAWRDTEATFDMHERYPQFKFIILHVTSMSDASHSDCVIDGVARILKQYQTVGLIIVGTGRRRTALEKQAIRLGLQDQVIFEPQGGDILSFMKSSNILVHLSEDPDDEQIVLQAAAVGLPMISGVAGLPGELFLDGESAFVCPNDSPPCVTQKINTFLNKNQLRAKFSMNAQAIVFSRIEQDYDAYMRAYRNSIERCLVSDG